MKLFTFSSVYKLSLHNGGDFMLHAKSFRTKLILIITGVIILFGLTYLISPMFVLATFHFDRSNFLISPISENYTFIVLAYVTLIVGLSVLAWRKSKWTIALTTISVILFGGLMYASTLGYIAFHDDYVILNTATEEQKFQWTELDHIKHEYKNNGTAGTYYFSKGEEVISINETGQFTYPIRLKIIGLATKNKVPFEELLIE